MYKKRVHRRDKVYLKNCIVVVVKSRNSMGKKSVTEYKRAQALALYDAGFTISHVARQLNISWTCAKNAITRYNDYGVFKDLPRPGRPSKIKPRGVNYLRRLINGNNRTNANIITQQFNNSLNGHISSRTVQRYLHKMGYMYSTKIKKPILTKTHKAKRMAWCKKFKHYTIADWRHVIFSDESTFYILKRKNKVMVWRTKDEKFAPDCIQHISTGDGKTGVWGGICGGGATALLLYSDNMDSNKYCEVLRNQLVPLMKQLPKRQQYTYQCDLAPWHTSNKVKEEIQRLNINLLEWPPNSPDLNVIEELWSIIDKRLASKQINNKIELVERLEEEWKKISIQLCRALVDTMPQRIEKCLKAKGGHFG